MSTFLMHPVNEIVNSHRGQPLTNEEQSEWNWIVKHKFADSEEIHLSGYYYKDDDYKRFYINMLKHNKKTLGSTFVPERDLQFEKFCEWHTINIKSTESKVTSTFKTIDLACPSFSKRKGRAEAKLRAKAYDKRREEDKLRAIEAFLKSS